MDISLDDKYVDGNADALYYPRKTEKESWDWVLDQLQQAADLMPAPTSVNLRANKYTALAMKARVALWAASESKYWNRAPLNSGYVAVQKKLTYMEASYADAYYQMAIDAAEPFMKWDNAMSDVAKFDHRFEDAQIAAYQNGNPTWTDRDGNVHDAIYTDWYNESYKKFSVNQQYNASLSGGTETVNYYFGVGYADDNPILKGDTFGYKRYNLNANISVNLTKDLTMRYTSAIRQTNNLGMGSFDQEWNIFYYPVGSVPWPEFIVSR